MAAICREQGSVCGCWKPSRTLCAVPQPVVRNATIITQAVLIDMVEWYLLTIYVKHPVFLVLFFYAFFLPEQQSTRIMFGRHFGRFFGVLCLL